MRFDPQTNRVSEEQQPIIAPPIGATTTRPRKRSHAPILAAIATVLGGAWLIYAEMPSPEPPRRVAPSWQTVVGDFDEAEAVLEDVEREVEERERDSESRAAYEEARTLLAIGRASEARELLRKSIELDPRFVEARYDLGLACVRAGDRAAARVERDALRELDPNLANLLDNLVN